MQFYGNSDLPNATQKCRPNVLQNFGYFSDRNNFQRVVSFPFRHTSSRVPLPSEAPPPGLQPPRGEGGGTQPCGAVRSGWRRLLPTCRCSNGVGVGWPPGYPGEASHPDPVFVGVAPFRPHLFFQNRNRTREHSATTYQRTIQPPEIIFGGTFLEHLKWSQGGI